MATDLCINGEIVVWRRRGIARLMDKLNNRHPSIDVVPFDDFLNGITRDTSLYLEEVRPGISEFVEVWAVHETESEAGLNDVDQYFKILQEKVNPYVVLVTRLKCESGGQKWNCWLGPLSAITFEKFRKKREKAKRILKGLFKEDRQQVYKEVEEELAELEKKCRQKRPSRSPSTKTGTRQSKSKGSKALPAPP